LICIVKHKSAFAKLWVLRTFLEFRRLRIRLKGQVHEIDSAVRYVRSRKTPIGKKFRVSQKFPFSSLGGENAKPFRALRFGVLNTLRKQLL